MAGMTQSARNCMSSSGPPLGSISLVAGCCQAVDECARQIGKGSPRRENRQAEAGLHGAGSMIRRSLVFSRVTFNRKTASARWPQPDEQLKQRRADPAEAQRLG